MDDGSHVQGCHYYCDFGSGFEQKPASIFLVEYPDGRRQVQWWKCGKPTPYHGEWTKECGTLHVAFNCRFSEDEDGRSWPLKHCFLRRFIREGKIIYDGEDEEKRKIQIIPYGMWIWRKESSEFQELISPDTSVQIPLADQEFQLINGASEIGIPDEEWNAVCVYSFNRHFHRVHCKALSDNCQIS